MTVNIQILWLLSLVFDTFLVNVQNLITFRQTFETFSELKIYLLIFLQKYFFVMYSNAVSPKELIYITSLVSFIFANQLCTFYWWICGKYICHQSLKLRKVFISCSEKPLVYSISNLFCIFRVVQIVNGRCAFKNENYWKTIMTLCLH